MIDTEKMDWNALRNTATRMGIKIYRKKRVDIIKELKDLKKIYFLG